MFGCIQITFLGGSRYVQFLGGKELERDSIDGIQDFVRVDGIEVGVRVDIEVGVRVDSVEVGVRVDGVEVDGAVLKHGSDVLTISHTESQ